MSGGAQVQQLLMGQVPTVRGPIEVSQLGRVLMHEHIFCRTRDFYLPQVKEFLVDQFQRVSSGKTTTIVDLTTYTLPDDYIEVCKAVPNVNVICCAGYYTKHRIPAAYRNLDANGLADKLRQKLINGIGARKIKPGIIKIATSGYVFTKLEKDIIRAAATVQSERSVPIATHACRAGRQQLEQLLNCGANPRKVFLSHLEMELKGNKARLFDEVASDVLWILKQGAYVFFGDFTAGDTPYRRQLLRLIRLCVDSGYIRQIFLSTDSYWTCRSSGMRVRGSSLNTRTPRTYDYVFTLICPLLRENGFTDREFNEILERNPADFFSI